MEAVTSAWQKVDWDRLQARVEAEVDSLGQRQDDSETRRKRLVEESNSYRDRTDKEARKVAVPLIKAFQAEFDGLLARSTAAETALIDICSSIVNLPDPKSLLKGAEAWKNDADKTQKAVEEREDLKRQLLKANSELEEFRGKDVKVRKLKDKLVKLESEQDILIETAVSEAENKVEREFDSKLAELEAEKDKMKEQNEHMEKSMNSLESKNKEIQRQLEIAQMTVEQREGLDNEQLSIALKDLSDAKNKIVFLEEKVSQLEKEAQTVSESKKAGKIEDIAALGSVLVQKDETIQQLTDDLQQTKSAHSEQFAKWKADFSALEQKNQSLTNEMSELKVQLEGKMDYEAIKNELRLLREIEFGATADANAESIERLGETVETLDRLLAEKNRRLQNENASLRVMNEGFKGDAVMTAIVTGSHSNIVETIGKKIGIEEACKYRQRNLDSDHVSRVPILVPKKKKEEKEFRFDDPNVDVLTYLKKVKEKKIKERAAMAPVPSKQVTRSDTYTITTTALPPIFSNMPVLKEEVRQDEDMKLSTTQSMKRFTSPTKVVETKTTEEQKAEQEVITKMQQRIQDNIQALNGRALNTTEIAMHCKRLMIAYNIGQRLFAKLVMNQVVKSQGSLSELLSKPRHWSKLTDKGREAFRRIYGWMSDDEAIDWLCSLSPRRVWPADQSIEHPIAETLIDYSEPEPLECKEELTFPEPPASPPQEDLAVREIKAEPVSPIEFISFEPAMVSPPPPPAPQESNTRVPHIPLRASRWRHDDISKEKILSIFQTEMAKLEEQKTTVDKAVAGKLGLHSRRFSNASSISFESSSLSGKIRPSAVETVLKQRMAIGLQPLTQEQYDTYASLDTELLVKQIKEFLLINSISQRQFGEFILGLSQGSVSDLLARPKTWAHLTQKGREPFIRMQLFMDDVETANSNQSEEKQPQITVCEEDSELAKTLATILKAVNPEPVIQEKTELKREPESEIDLIMQKEGGSKHNGLVKYIDISGEEILDTYKIVYRVKEVLADNKISPRVFGEEYLGCVPTMCADLMMRTKTFEVSKPAEKVMYQRMRDFLSNPSAIPGLVKKEAARGLPKDRMDNLFRESTTSTSSTRALKRKQSSDGSDYEPSTKKPIQRTVITDYQKDTLRFVFANEQHPTNELCEEMALKLDMSVRTVMNWFHNHRTRSKAREKEGKVYSDALPNGKTVKIATWQEELQKMMDNAPALAKQWAPDYKDREDLPSALTGNQVRSSAESPTNNNGSPLFNFETAPITSPPKKQSGGQLDKLVARMRQMAEARTDEQDAQLSSLKERAENSERLVAQLESDLASAVQGLGQTENMGTNDMLNSSPSSKAPDASLVPILTSQRNRLHERVTSLEETVSLEKTKQLAVQNELETVRAENIKLVERVRFLQSPHRSVSSVESGIPNEPVNRNKKLSLHDKTTLQMGRAILASSNTRTAFFVYLVLLHVLIMLVLYKFAFDQSVVRDAETECEYKFHQHMMDNHKQG